VPEDAIEIEWKASTAWIWMNRTEVHNAFDAQLVQELTDAFTAHSAAPGVRAIVLGGRGKSFSAGAQVEWMRQQGAASFEDNLKDARRLAKLFRAISEAPVPTVARVQGAAIGGGTGLVCACDIAIAARTAVFATSEVRLGLIPAVIAPYVLRAVGERHARRLFLTGERVDAVTAQKLGLVHEVVASEDPEDLNARVEGCITMLLAGAPGAQREAKSLIAAVAGQVVTDALAEDTAQRIAQRRSDPEAAEGLDAFLSKRSASWVR